MAAHRALFDLYKAPFLMVDPGDGGTIRIDRFLGVVPVVTGGAEARALAVPTKAGLMAAVLLDTDGGDLTLTVTEGYNQAGATAMTFDDAGDWVLFVAVKVGANFRWRVAASEGVDVGTPDRARVIPQGNPSDTGQGDKTLTIAQLLTGIVTQTPTGNRTLTLPTGTLADGGVTLAVNEAFDWVLINLASAAHSLTVAAGTDHTVVGEMEVPAAKSGIFRTRKTAADTFVTYRIDGG